ncbi:hypothetical protein PIB30_053834 [Stylosanthes scabra]|uniref:Uncharacterized protein n=1 Tax=Stylosanthes scabra TaxID=79078 RepID=A0ABU6TJ00_9FABA|nr:hypothetical protein [Stylosanthes scabra]
MYLGSAEPEIRQKFKYPRYLGSGSADLRYVSRDCIARDSSVSYIRTAEPETLLTLTLSSFIFTILGRKKLFLSFLFDMAPRGRSRTPGRGRSGDQPAAAPEANPQDPEGLYRLNDE